MTVTTAAGFEASGVAAGIKADGHLDLALLSSSETAAVAGVFTTSHTAAPPVHLTRTRVRGGAVRALVVNSGAANAGTGAAGLADAEAMAAAAAGEIGCLETEVLVCSTGPIGGRLPLDRIRSAMPELAASRGRSHDDGMRAARAIMTTDSVPKSAAVSGAGFSVGGIAKGAGMLRPDMATMLAFLTTDAVASATDLAPILREAAAVTFNCLNVDGCQSTNDTVLLLASGASGTRPPPDELAMAVEEVCRDLAEQMARDAEGASRVVRIEVRGAASRTDARRLGMGIADSALVRSSFFGGDPNWGRVLAACGVTGVPVDPACVDITYDGTPVCRGGVGEPFDEDEVAGRLAGDFTVAIRVGDGPGSADILTTDLTPDYVRFNGERS